MRKNSTLVYPLSLVAGDFLALVGAFTIAYLARVTFDPRPLLEQIPALEYIKLFALLIPFWLLFFAALGLYSSYVYSNRWRELWRIAVGSFVGMLFIIGYDFAIDPDSTIFPARLVALYALLLGFSLLVLERQIMWQIKKILYRFNRGIENVMLIGSSRQTRDVAQLLGDTRTSGYKIEAIVGGKDALPPNYNGQHYSQITQALRALDSLAIDTIIQTKLYDSDETNQAIQAAALERHIDYKLTVSEHDYLGGRMSVELFHFLPVIHVSPTPLLGWGRFVKRLFDTLVSVVMLILLSPVLVFTVLAITVFDYGPVFFRQERLTRYGKSVSILKFRTMKNRYSGRDPKEVFSELGQPELYEQWKSNRAKVTNDPRISKLGAFLRASSLDELPQLWNVLLGQISLVGPRTIPPKEAEADFREKSPLILSVKTGITGLAQVSGRSDLTIEERIRLDQFYVQNWTVWLDFKILIKTIGTVFSRRGAE